MWHCVLGATVVGREGGLVSRADAQDERLWLRQGAGAGARGGDEMKTAAFRAAVRATKRNMLAFVLSGDGYLSGAAPKGRAVSKVLNSAFFPRCLGQLLYRQNCELPTYYPAPRRGLSFSLLHDAKPRQIYQPTNFGWVVEKRDGPKPPATHAHLKLLRVRGAPDGHALGRRAVLGMYGGGGGQNGEQGAWEFEGGGLRRVEQSFWFQRVLKQTQTLLQAKNFEFLLCPGS